MNKWKALLLGILFAACACMLLLLDGFSLIVFLLGCTAVLFLGIWHYKHQRDQRILSQAEQERQIATQSPQAIPPMTSEGSRQLFVPPQLHQDK